MKRRLAQLLACPVDRQPLLLSDWQSETRQLTPADRARAEALSIQPADLEHRVITGVLTNPRPRIAFPIVRGIPRLLVFPTPLHHSFRKEHADRLRDELPGFSFPELPGAPGEMSVLQSFSTEWTNYDWDGKTYWNLTTEEWLRCMQVMLDLDTHSVRGKLVLEMGMGVGGTAHHLATNFGAEVVGVDLSSAVEVAQRHFDHAPFFHVVQASVFSPPVAEASIDFAYSFGVIHHTYSTKAAFDQICRLPRPGGRLYVWVYSHLDERRDAIRRFLMHFENLTRPLISRLPGPLQTVTLLPLVPLYMGFQALRKLRTGGGQSFYGMREALHAARDRFTPRFIHRHDEHELMAWFRAAGFDELEGSPHGRSEGVPEAFLACAAVSGRRVR